MKHSKTLLALALAAAFPCHQSAQATEADATLKEMVVTAREIENKNVHRIELAPSQPELHLRADRVTPYEKVADILAVAQRAGVMKIAFVTEAAK